MATILIYTTPARGHLYPIMDTALALKARGHDVRLRTLSDEVARVRATGLAASPIDARIEARPVDDWQVRSPLASAKRAVATFVARAALEVEDLRAAIAAEEPDLLVVDTNAWGAQAVAEVSGLPWATWHPYPLPYPSKDAPPFGPGFAPARGPFGRLRDRLFAPLVIGPMQRALPDLNRARALVGAPALGHIADLFVRPPLLLHMTAEPFEYRRRDWPQNVRLVGPGLWSPPSTVPLPALSSDNPVVLVTCSTEFQDDGALVQAALDALGADRSIQLVCTTAGVDPTQFRAPAGVVVERFLPHAELLSRACVVVCHGGMGITQRALAAGVPVCVVPWGRDQLEVGRRVVECGAGAIVPRSKLTSARLRTAVSEARRNADAAAKVCAGFVAAGGAPRCAELLEGVLAAHPPRGVAAAPLAAAVAPSAAMPQVRVAI